MLFCDPVSSHTLVSFVAWRVETVYVGSISMCGRDVPCVLERSEELAVGMIGVLVDYVQPVGCVGLLAGSPRARVWQ